MPRTNAMQKGQSALRCINALTKREPFIGI
jgi:hypothetical protein